MPCSPRRRLCAASISSREIEPDSEVNTVESVLLEEAEDPPEDRPVRPAPRPLSRYAEGWEVVEEESDLWWRALCIITASGLLLSALYYLALVWCCGYLEASWALPSGDFVALRKMHDISTLYAMEPQAVNRCQTLPCRK